MNESSSLGPLLKKLFVSRPALARQLGVSLQTVHNWCSGRISLPPRRLGQIAEVLATRGARWEEISSLVRAELDSQGLTSSMMSDGSRADKVKNRTVMIVTWDLAAGGLFSPVAQLCRESLEHVGYECLVSDCGGEHRLKRSYVRQAIAMRCAGVMLIGVPGDVPDPDDELLSAIEPAREHETPVVLVAPWTRSLALPRGVAGIGWDINSAAELGIDFLTAAGHEAIGALVEHNGPVNPGRYSGIDAAVHRLDIKIHNDMVVGPDEDPDDLSAVERLLERSSAVFASPLSLPRLARACYQTGAHWPEDVSIITIGHPQVTRQMGPKPFTYVGMPVGKVSRGAAQLLLSMTQDNEPSYGQEFVLYGSSAMAIQHPEGGSVGKPAHHPVSVPT